MNTYYIYTSAFSNENGICGTAYLIIDENGELFYRKAISVKNGESRSMNINAIISAVYRLPLKSSVIIYCSKEFGDMSGLWYDDDFQKAIKARNITNYTCKDNPVDNDFQSKVSEYAYYSFQLLLSKNKGETNTFSDRSMMIQSDIFDKMKTKNSSIALIAEKLDLELSPMRN